MGQFERKSLDAIVDDWCLRTLERGTSDGGALFDRVSQEVVNLVALLAGPSRPDHPTWRLCVGRDAKRIVRLGVDGTNVTLSVTNLYYGGSFPMHQLQIIPGPDDAQLVEP